MHIRVIQGTAQLDSPSEFDSHAQIQVPDLQLLLINSSKYCSPLWGPCDITHGLLDGGEAQQGLQVVLFPQLDSPV